MITVNEQSSIQFRMEKTIYVDPFHLKEALHDADFIFITHPHYDHFCMEDILKCRKEDTVVFTVSDTYDSLLSSFSPEQIHIVHPGESFSLGDISVETVPAYNLHQPFHPKEKGWVGYLFTIDGCTYYVMGDTDVLPFMETVSCDTLFIPIGGTYTMTMEEALSLVRKMKPRMVVPIHYGTIVGTPSLGEQFLSSLPKGVEGKNLLSFPSHS